MKAGIHPEYKEATITCACGASYRTRSTRGSFAVEVCSNCHPFFTGKQRIIDTAGRVERFRRKYEVAQARENARAAPEGSQTKRESTQTKAATSSAKPKTGSGKTAGKSRKNTAAEA